MKSPAAVLYDRENNWAIQDAQGPRNENMFYTEAVQKQYRALREQGLNVDVISMEHELSSYKIVAAPMAYMFKDGYEERLRAYAENGGTLVITYWTGLVDGTDKCFLGGTPYGLMEAAGLVLRRSMLFMTGKRTMEFQNRAIIWESAAPTLARTFVSW